VAVERNSSFVIGNVEEQKSGELGDESRSYSHMRRCCGRHERAQSFKSMTNERLVK